MEGTDNRSDRARMPSEVSFLSTFEGYDMSADLFPSSLRSSSSLVSQSMSIIVDISPHQTRPCSPARRHPPLPIPGPIPSHLIPSPLSMRSTPPAFDRRRPGLPEAFLVRLTHISLFAAHFPFSLVGSKPSLFYQPSFSRPGMASPATGYRLFPSRDGHPG